MNEHSPRKALTDEPLPTMETVGLASLDELEENRQRANALEIDVKAIWSAVYRNRFIIISVIALAILLGMVAALLSTPIYRATGSVQIDQATAKVLETEQNDPTTGGVQDTERFLQTQLDILKSRSLAIRVTDSLGLGRNNQFLTAMGAPPSNGTIPGLDAAGTRRERVIRLLMKNMDVQLPRSSRIASISFDSPDPSLAEKIANAYVESYITANLRRRFDTSAYTRSFLSNQLAETKERLEQSERAMIDYARTAELIDTTGAATRTSGGDGSTQTGNPASLTMSNLVSVNSAYSAAKAQRIAAQQKWELAQRTPVMSLPEVMADPLISRMKGDQAQAMVDLQQNKERFGENHPTIVQLNARIAELNGQIARQAQAIKTSIRDAYTLATKQEDALNANVSSLTRDTLAEQDRGIQFNILRREVDTNRAMYEGLLQRFKEVSAAAGITTNNISVIDRAERPSGPISPNMQMNMVLGGLGGLALALAIVFVREKFDDVIRSPEDIDRKLGLPYLNAIPILDSGESVDDALANQRSHFSEAYFALRTAIELASPLGLPHSLFFTSSAPAEGKSTTAFAIARAFAQVGRKTILIDADLRKPTLHRELALPNDAGLSNVLAQHRQLSDAVQPSPFPNLDVMTSGKLPPNPAELLSGSAFPEMIAALQERYDLVLIDGPPVLGLADAPAISSVTEATVFVIEANRSARGKTKAAIRRLLGARAKIMGAVLTKFDAKRIGYGTEYGYYYYYYGSANAGGNEGRRSAGKPRTWFGR